MITTTTLCLPSLLSPPPAESPSQTHPATLHMPFAHCIFIPVASSSSGDIDGAKVGSFLPALIDSITASVDTPLSPQCAILDTRLLLHPLQLQTAILRTHLALATGKALRTRSLYSELLYNLSPSVNISDATRQFGINPETRNILVVVVNSDPELSADILDHIKTLVNIHDVTVDGSGSTPLETSLEAQADMEAICSVFKIDKKKGIDSSSLLSQIINGQALKGYN